MQIYATHALWLCIVTTAALALWFYMAAGSSMLPEKPPAIYHPSPGSTTPWRYRVVFHNDHTLDEHFENIGFTLRIAYQGRHLSEILTDEEEQRLEDLGDPLPMKSGGYCGTLTDEQREKVLGDPGVKSVSQYSGDGEFA